MNKQSHDKRAQVGKPESYLGWADLFERGLVRSKTQARRQWEKGRFPRPVHLSERVIAFKESSVEHYATDPENYFEPSKSK
jgi:hypothetical protein